MSIIEELINVKTISVDADLSGFVEEYDYVHVLSDNIIYASDNDYDILEEYETEGYYSEDGSITLKDYIVQLTDRIGHALSDYSSLYDVETINNIGKLISSSLNYEFGGIQNGLGYSFGASITGINVAVIYDDIIDEALGIGVKISKTGGDGNEAASKVLDISNVYKCKENDIASKLLASAKNIINSV